MELLSGDKILSFCSLQLTEERFTLMSAMATFCMQSHLWADIEGKNGWNNGKSRGWGGPGKCGLERKIRASGDGYSLIEFCSPVLLTWRFVAVMNILPGIVEASLGGSVFSSSSTQGRLYDSTDGWLELLFSCSTR
ncbi:hypothetical protein VZT92_012883 [Zoarces viviparus]|uniref:Uncharacterized protein n=1 Tax=Zoarces viviparus TaxID=48416 RepID=A0AAW1F213_ZOAVI